MKFKQKDECCAFSCQLDCISDSEATNNIFTNEKKSKKLTYKKYISKCMHFSLTLNSAESVWQADENHS